MTTDVYKMITGVRALQVAHAPCFCKVAAPPCPAPSEGLIASPSQINGVGGCSKPPVEPGLPVALQSSWAGRAAFSGT